jgi:hypothetical protein
LRWVDKSEEGLDETQMEEEAIEEVRDEDVFVQKTVANCPSLMHLSLHVRTIKKPHCAPFSVALASTSEFPHILISNLITSPRIAEKLF